MNNLNKKKEQYFCLNCENPIFFEDSYYITTCEYCNWRNELNDKPEINPITIKTKLINDNNQICYPFLEETDLDEIPEKLKEGILIYFRDQTKFTKKHKENIYHNLYKKDSIKFIKLSKKFENKAKLTQFFQSTNFIKEFDCKNKESCDEYLEGNCTYSEDCPEYKK